MIYTITLNPAIDHIILMENDLIANKTNYYSDEYFVIGGKGINVGIILKNLENNVMITGIIGKNNKNLFLEKFSEIDIKNNFFINKGNTRTNYKIKNLSTKQETELNGQGFKTELINTEKLLNYLDENIIDGDIVVTTGSIPKNIESNIYELIGNIANKHKAIFICDAAKDNLKFALKEKPFLIKPNIDELNDLLNTSISEDDLNGITFLIKKTKLLGAQNILLSMGSKGSYYFSNENEIIKIGVAKGKLVNSVGAGDSMLAGYIHGLSLKMNIEDCLKYAAAAGGATAFTSWLATKKEIENHIQEIVLEKIKQGDF
ncbi:1-phosphofructokinase family hexose kinase [Spiroplasma endosymbiont of Labia minor]|uniref:1-phosphofructokinase n=1 Tax=Spiroplasma endosymbiont of Labia minor TaxID=3066305 RepID=UPI0030D2F6DB